MSGWSVFCCTLYIVVVAIFGGSENGAYDSNSGFNAGLSLIIQLGVELGLALRHLSSTCVHKLGSVCPVCPFGLWGSWAETSCLAHEKN